MEQTRKPIIYIAGPDHCDLVYDRRDELRANGYTPLLPFSAPEGMNGADYALICLQTLNSADAVLLVGSWYRSSSAMLAFEFCRSTGKPVASNIDDLPIVLDLPLVPAKEVRA